MINVVDFSLNEDYNVTAFCTHLSCWFIATHRVRTGCNHTETRILGGDITEYLWSTTYSWPSASSPMPPVSTFRHSASPSGAGALIRYEHQLPIQFQDDITISVGIFVPRGSETLPSQLSNTPGNFNRRGTNWSRKWNRINNLCTYELNSPVHNGPTPSHFPK